MQVRGPTIPGNVLGTFIRSGSHPRKKYNKYNKALKPKGGVKK